METTSYSSSSNKNNQNDLNVLIKKCSIFDLKQSKPLLDNIKEIIEGFHTEEENAAASNLKRSPKTETDLTDVKIELNEKDIEKIKNISISDKLYCTTCNHAFVNREEQIEHYKCDLHLFNVKQKLKGKKCVTVEEFEQLTDISSISGSDSETEKRITFESSSSSSHDESHESTNYARVARNKPKISFRLHDSNVLVMQRCILHGKKNFPDDQKVLLEMVKSTSQDDYWSIILVAAGHFAAAIFKGDTVVTHKTFHRYVVRAKRGTVQSQHDSSGKHAKSVGANIRRSQEAAFKDDIRLLLGSQWKQDLDKCKCIFIRVPSYNRHVLISTNTGNATQSMAPFTKDDSRLRHIPFMTFRPTFNEVKRAHTVLAKIELYDSMYLTVLNKFISPKSTVTEPQLVSKKTNEKKSKQNLMSKLDTSQTEEKETTKETTDSEEETISQKNEEKNESECNTSQNDFIQGLGSDELKIFNEIYTACFTNNVNKLKQLLGDENTDDSKGKAIEKLLNKRLNKEKGYTILHLTSELGHSDCVWQLLLRGADPALPDLTRQRRVPFFLVTSKATRDQYRRFMNDFPLRYDYKAARIDSPLTQDQMNEKAEKEREKKRNQRKQKKQREAQIKQQEKQQDSEAAERQRFLSLTDQEKRRLIIDRNFLNVVPLNSNDETNTDKSKVKFSPKEIKIISRCWTCAADMSTSVPFEYFDYKFCSTKCLKIHRENQKQSGSTK